MLVHVLLVELQKLGWELLRFSLRFLKNILALDVEK
jgi:hypothetical protein